MLNTAIYVLFFKNIDLLVLKSTLGLLLFMHIMYVTAQNYVKWVGIGTLIYQHNWEVLLCNQVYEQWRLNCE